VCKIFLVQLHAHGKVGSVQAQQHRALDLSYFFF
jgi:hypothetical protein